MDLIKKSGETIDVIPKHNLKMKNFDVIYQRAVDRKGGEAALNKLSTVTLKTDKELRDINDDDYLSAMSKAIFKAGFVWNIVDHKWPGFEQAFWHFNVDRCAWISPDDIDNLLGDKRIIRHYQKIMSVLTNATMMIEIRQSHHSFGNFIANWPSANYVELLSYLHQHGARLGPITCQYFLRSVGKDGFILSRDGVAALIDAGVIDKNPSSKRDLQLVQNAYNQWQQETGFNYAQLSRILAFSIDAV
jgi:3-methyladenine DNA glycosylase Tag